MNLEGENDMINFIEFSNNNTVSVGFLFFVLMIKACLLITCFSYMIVNSSQQYMKKCTSKSLHIHSCLTSIDRQVEISVVSKIKTKKKKLRPQEAN